MELNHNVTPYPALFFFITLVTTWDYITYLYIYWNITPCQQDLFCLFTSCIRQSNGPKKCPCPHPQHLWICFFTWQRCFPGGANGKELACQFKRQKRRQFGHWIGKIPWRRAWQPLQYSCVENPMDRGTWRPMVHGVAKSQTQLKPLSMQAGMHMAKGLWKYDQVKDLGMGRLH